MGEVRVFPGRLAPPSGLGFLQGLPSEEGLHLIAFAEGALPALRTAFQEGARSLTLLSPILRTDPLLAAKLAALRFALEAGGVEGFARVARAFLFGPRTVGSEEILAAWKEGLSPEGIAAWLVEVGALGDQRRWLRGTGARLLVVQGALDALTPPLYGQEVADFAKGQALRFTVEGAGHLAPWEAPEEVAELVADFLLGESFRPLPGGLAL